MPRRKVLQPIGFRSRSSRRRGEDVSVIGGLGDLESMWARALQMAEEVYQETFVPEEITNLNDALQQTRQTELSLDAARTSLLRLHGAGGATPADFAAYNAIQSNLAQTQTSLLVASRRVFRRRPDVLRRLPIKVRKAPRLSMATVGISGFGYFGVDPVTGTAAGGGAAVAGMAPWMVCAIILAAIVAVGLIAWVIGTAIGLTAESMRDVIVTRAQTSAYESMVEGRSRVFDACMAGGGNSADCAGQAQDAVPTPEDAAAPLPDPAGAWVKWVAIGVMVVAGVYIYSDVQRRRNRSMLPVAGLSRSLLFSPQR